MSEIEEKLRKKLKEYTFDYDIIMQVIKIIVISMKKNIIMQLIKILLIQMISMIMELNYVMILNILME